MDCLRKALSKDKSVEFIAIDAQDLVTESMHRTGAWPPAMIHLGQALIGCTLLQSITSKESSTKLSLQWHVTGPFGNMYVESNHLGQTRGTIMSPEAPVQNLHAKLGPGTLHVRRYLGSVATGIVPAVGDICTDLLAYLHRSEQRRCAMNLCVDLGWNDQDKKSPVIVKKALGYLIEILPIENEQKREAIAMYWEERLKELGGLSKWNIGPDPTKHILKILSDESKPQEMLYQSISFSCNCTEERAIRALNLAISQNDKEGEDLETNTPDEVLTCEFCGKVYKV